ncbi:MAG: type III secretion protein J [Bradymonadia bacterium]|jgi:type III secretion protein J
MQMFRHDHLMRLARFRDRVVDALRSWAPLVVAVFVLSACTADVHHGLDERSANDAVVVLAQHNIVADKARDAEGWRIVVPRAQQQTAIATLAALGLPREQADYEEMFGESGGLVPSASDERARRAVALGRHVAATLAALDGVRDAYVHLTLARDSSRLGGSADTRLPARASVVVTHRADVEPPPDDVIRGVVVGAVEGLEPGQISVIRSSVAVPPPPETSLVAVGPFVVSESSASGVWGVLGGLSAVLAMLALALIWCGLRQPSEPA